MRAKVVTATLTMLALGVTAGCGGDSGGSGDAAASTGPIKVWLSNNPEEIAWGEQMVKAWNADHPEEEITAQEIPAGKTSEEVIGAAITAGNAPCLVFNTSPAAVPGTTEAWMLGSGVSLLLDALTTPAHDKKVEVSARLHEKAAAKKRHLRRSRRRAAALAASAQLGDKARDASQRASERLQVAGEHLGERAVELRDEYQPVAAKKLKKARKKARKQAKHVAAAARTSAEGVNERLHQVAS